MSDGQRFLRIAELYLSLQGEGVHAGLPCFFVRTAGCDLRCAWCDTPEALVATAGRWYGKEELTASIPEAVRLVQITGGEPLLQKEAVAQLCDYLLETGRSVLLETGGHRSLEGIPKQVHVVMDIKLPDSGEARHDFESNIAFLKTTDEIKFVVASAQDFAVAVSYISRLSLERFGLLFSPVWGAMKPSVLAKLVLDSGIWGRMQLQQHKIVWGAEARGV